MLTYITFMKMIIAFKRPPPKKKISKTFLQISLMSGLKEGGWILASAPATNQLHDAVFVDIVKKIQPPRNRRRKREGQCKSPFRSLPTVFDTAPKFDRWMDASSLF